MEPSKKKLKLDIINLNYKFQDLTLKRKNNIIDSNQINKKVKLDIKRKNEIDENKINKKAKIDYDEIKSNKINSDEIKSKKIDSDEIKSNKINSDEIKSNKINSDEIKSNKKAKLELKGCGQEYLHYNKQKENDNDPDNESFKQYKRLPPDDMIYRYII